MLRALLSGFARFRGGRDKTTCFVRIIDKRPKAWLEGDDDDVRGLTKQIRDTRGVSIYQVDSDIDECEVAAAVKSLSGGVPKTVHVVRLEDEHLNRAGLIPKKSDGKTGVASVDARHFDLDNDEERLVVLVEAVLEGQRAGRDLVRQVTQLPMYERIRAFIGLPEGQVDPGALKRYKSQLSQFDQKRNS